MIRTYIILVFALMAMNYNLYAQREGYIVMVKDTSYIQGYLNYAAEDLNVDSIGYAKLRRSTFIYFKPEELLEYGLNGKVFVSKDIDQERKFLRQLMPGDRSLYLTRLSGKRTYYLEADSQLMKLKKESYKEQLKSSIPNWDDEGDMTEVIRFKRKALSRYVQHSNGSPHHYFPYRRTGLFIGNSNRTVRFSYRGFNPELVKSYGLAIGFYIDTPIEVYTKWSTRIELEVVSHKLNLYEENAYIARDYNISLTTINLPILVRYRAYGESVVPFADLGFVIGLNAESDINLVETRYDVDPVEVKEYNLEIIDKKDFGLAAGVGLDYLINHKRTIGIELRYQFSFGMEGRIDHTIQALELLASYNF